MKLLEAWHKSKLPYKEIVYRSLAEEKGRMWWGSFGRKRIGEDQQNDHELTKNALRIAKWDKLLVSIFNVLAAVIPFTAQVFGAPILGLTSAVSLSLAITFGFTMLYAIQTLLSFISPESSALLSTLPLNQNDVSMITLFSFIRSVDYMIIGSIISQVSLVTYYTGSFVALLVMLAASIINGVLAVAAALWFSKMFTKNLSNGGRSKCRTFLRLFFIMMWGTLLMSVSFLISLPWYIVPTLELTIKSNLITNLFLSLIHPFSVGIIIANIGHSLTEITKIIAAVSLTMYALFAVFAGKWILNTVNNISHGIHTKVSRVTAKDFSIKIHTPLFGFIMKDLKISSKNPATALFFAFPILETVIVSFLLANFEVLRASTLLVSSFMGGIFVLLVPLILLNSEGTGLEYTKTLPLDVNRIILSKTIISTLIYIPVPATLFLMAFLKPFTSWLTLLIPLFVMLAIVSASIFEIHLFLNSVSLGKISALFHDLKKLIVGAIILLIPIAAYSASYLISFNHLYAILCMIGASASELAIALYILRQN